MKSFINTFAIISFLINGLYNPLFVGSSLAVSTPSFPICLNPQGTIKASYSSGTHGIVGDSKEYKGSDSVYQLSDDTFTQCFCAEDGSGIQTNWWNVSGLSDPEIQVLKNLGWQYVPSGALWGLENASYVAQNSSYSCKGISDRTAGSSASSDSGRGGTDGGSVLAAATSILGLAQTGNISFIYSLFGVGFTSILLGFTLRKNG